MTVVELYRKTQPKETKTKKSELELAAQGQGAVLRWVSPEIHSA